MTAESQEDPLRVGQVIGTFSGGGAQRQALNLVLGLRSLGVDARGIAVRARGDFVDGIPQAEHFVELGADRSRVATWIRAAFRLRSLARRWRPHVLHVQGADSLRFVWWALRGMRSRPRMYFTWQDSGQVLQRAGRARREMVRALAACDGVFGSSADVAARLSEGAGIPRVGVFHGGVPLRSPSHPSEPPLLLWVGRMEPAKGPDLLLRAASELKRRHVRFRLVLVGGAHAGSTYDAAMHALVRSEGIADLVELVGYVTDEALARWYAEAAIGVQSSVTEGLSMSLLEHMMAGLAIVATDVGDTAIALEGGRCGILVPRDVTPAGFADALEGLIRSSIRRNELGAAARGRALAAYGIEAMSRRALEIYRRDRTAARSH